MRSPVAGETWNIKSAPDPWGGKPRFKVVILDAKAGWVRYSMGAPFTDERMEVDRFTAIYQPTLDCEKPPFADQTHMIRRSIIPRILIPAVLLAAILVGLFGRLFAATPTAILVYNVTAHQPCRLTYAVRGDGNALLCDAIFASTFDKEPGQ